MIFINDLFCSTFFHVHFGVAAMGAVFAKVLSGALLLLLLLSFEFVLLLLLLLLLSLTSSCTAATGTACMDC